MFKQWQERTHPARLERRFNFDNYEALRSFLDDAAELSEREGLYPDIRFARNYVSITIHADEGCSELSEKQRRFARLLDDLRHV